ncbi:MAG: hypothetical protein KUG79_10800 [Pseudomonadales bacterium]|nr:hypothetical protein [Pseudomonadales bacterium]
MQVGAQATRPPPLATPIERQQNVQRRSGLELDQAQNVIGQATAGPDAEQPRKLSPPTEVETANAVENRAVKSGNEQPLSDSERLVLAKEIESLSRRDKEVRTHEQIHASLAGAYGGPPQFQFQKGPDGVLYAISGHVAIDASPVQGDPKATIDKAQTIKRAALGPSDPSSADRVVAAKASAMQAKASNELSKLVALENQTGANGFSSIA